MSWWWNHVSPPRGNYITLGGGTGIPRSWPIRETLSRHRLPKQKKKKSSAPHPPLVRSIRRSTGAWGAVSPYGKSFTVCVLASMRIHPHVYISNFSTKKKTSLRLKYKITSPSLRWKSLEPFTLPFPLCFQFWFFFPRQAGSLCTSRVQEKKNRFVSYW